MKVLDGNTVLERKWPLFILVALIVRALFIVYQVSDARYPAEGAHWAVNTGDTRSYIDPVEHLIAQGSYKPDYRMPGVSAPYFLFRQVLGPSASKDAMVVLQWILSSISVYFLSLVALRLSGSSIAAWTVYMLFLLSTYSSSHVSSLSSDSLAVSVLVLHVFFLQRAVDRSSQGLLLTAGFFIAWLVFLRPVAALLLAPALWLVLIHWRVVFPIQAVFCFLLPFMILDGAWTIRNYKVHGELSPLTNQGLMPDEIATRPRGYVMRFLQGYGGNYIWWEPGADIRWFGMWTGSGDVDNEGRDAKEPPAFAYVPGYTRDSLYSVSEQIRLIESGAITGQDSVDLVSKVNNDLYRYTALYQAEAPFNYHVLSRFRMIKYMVVQNGTETLFAVPFNELPVLLKVFKVVQSFLYLFSFGVGAIAIVVMLWQWRRTDLLLARWVPLIVLYMVMIYPLGLRMGEWRFMVHVFPLALMLAVVFVVGQWKTLRFKAKPLD